MIAGAGMRFGCAKDEAAHAGRGDAHSVGEHRGRDADGLPDGSEMRTDWIDEMHGVEREAHRGRRHYANFHTAGEIGTRLVGGPSQELVLREKRCREAELAGALGGPRGRCDVPAHLIEGSAARAPRPRAPRAAANGRVRAGCGLRKLPQGVFPLGTLWSAHGGESAHSGPRAAASAMRRHRSEQKRSSRTARPGTGSPHVEQLAT